MKWYRRRRARRVVAELSHDEAAQLMRILAKAGVNSPLVLILAERALETAPTRWRHTFEAWVRMLRAGRQIKVSVFPVRFLVPVEVELENAVEEAFAEMHDTEG